MGCQVFLRNQGKAANVECIYRVCQDGIRFLLPWLRNRILYTSDLQSFKRFICHRYHNELEDIADRELAVEISKLQIGCFIVIYKTGDA